jgi:hypothetical protein
VSGGRLGVKTRRCSGLPVQQQRTTSDRGSDAALGHSGWNGGKVGEASDRAIQGGAQGEAMVDFEQGSGGGAARTWETVLSEWEPASKYPCGARPDSAAHDSQLGCGAG